MVLLVLRMGTVWITYGKWHLDQPDNGATHPSSHHIVAKTASDTSPCDGTILFEFDTIQINKDAMGTSKHVPVQKALYESKCCAG